jgi:hypothetical protein
MPAFNAFSDGIGSLADGFKQAAGMANLGDGITGHIGYDQHHPQSLGKGILNELDAT